MSREHRGLVISGNITEIPQSKRLAPIWWRQLKVAAYRRGSTGCEEQQNRLKAKSSFILNTEYIQWNPYWRVSATYCDAVLGLRMNYRPGYRKLLKNYRRKKIDLILVKSLSRFGRDTAEIIKRIWRLKYINIGDYIETGSIDTLTTSEQYHDQLAALDQTERWSRSEFFQVLREDNILVMPVFSAVLSAQFRACPMAALSFSWAWTGLASWQPALPWRGVRPRIHYGRRRQFATTQGPSNILCTPDRCSG